LHPKRVDLMQEYVVIMFSDSGSSMLELSRLPRDYWQWIEALSGSESGRHGRVRLAEILHL